MHPGDLAGGFSDLEMTWLLYCAGAATADEQYCRSPTLARLYEVNKQPCSLAFGTRLFFAGSLEFSNMNTCTYEIKTRFCCSETGLVIRPKSRTSDLSRDTRAIIILLLFCRPTLLTGLSRVQYLYCRPSNHAFPFINTEHRIHHASIMT